jgi:glutathione synthase/RimK-type ligase-like ATP-grasp enzyme
MEMREAKPIGILYEHPAWFAPLFAELDRRAIPYERLPAHEQRFDPAGRATPYNLVVNRVSPSAYLRDHTSAIFYAQQYLAYLEARGVSLVNGARAYALELSKARQLATLAALDIPHPRSRVVNAPGQLAPAAAELAYPVIVKPNIGGSGALMRRFDRPGDLAAALADGELAAVFGLDHTAIVQEYHPPRGGAIVRVEVLDDRLLYAIRIHNDPDAGFNLCPADICRAPERRQPTTRETVEAGQQRKIEVADPPTWVVEAVRRVFQTARIDVGGVEYLESERDGQIYLYDVNALSNFVTDAPRLLGFDPFARFADYLERRAGIAGRRLAGAAS